MSPPLEDLIRQITAVGEGAPDLSRKRRLLEMVRAGSSEAATQLDLHLLTEQERLHRCLQEARAHLKELRAIHEKLTSPPWHLAVFLREVPGESSVMVSHNGTPRVVALAEDLTAGALQTGDEVFLNGELNLVLGKCPWGSPDVGPTALFQRRAPDGRLVLRLREEEFVVQPAGPLRDAALEEGDQIRWDRATHIAYEKIERGPTQRYFVSEIPDARPEQVGGHRKALESLLAALTTVLVAPDKARRYALDGHQTILMAGPPGCGKTLMARVAAAEIARLSGTQCHFAVVKPAEWEDPYVGVTQQNIRSCFEAMKRAAGEKDFAVLFLDEIEAVGRIRGSFVGHHSDKFLAALLAELDGFSARGRVAVISATNRKGLLDPALRERLSDIEINVPRPDMHAAREIFQIHLRESVPFSPDGAAAAKTRSRVIDRAVSRLFDPNADNQLCRIQLRDSGQRTVAARHLISGRLIEQICRAARQRAFLRDVQTGDAGLRAEDMDEAVSDALDRLATTLTPSNARSYLPDLPQDIDVVRVDPIRPVASHRYLRS